MFSRTSMVLGLYSLQRCVSINTYWNLPQRSKI